MDELNPYASPTTDSPPGSPGAAKRMRLWLGYLIAPLVAPLLAAVISFVAALMLVDPHDVGTPIGMFVLPVLVMTLGTILSYGVALFVGMPIVYWLRSKKRLNGSMIHLAALLFCLLIVGAYTGYWAAEIANVLHVLIFSGTAFLIVAPLVLVSTSVFWLIARPR